jgi:choline dehydrogenase-like flavoprotein
VRHHYNLHISIYLLSIITAGYFSDADEADIATLREGIKLARRLARSDAFAKFTGEEIFPGAECQTDSDLDEYIRNVSHPPYLISLTQQGLLRCSAIH